MGFVAQVVFDASLRFIRQAPPRGRSNRRRALFARVAAILGDPPIRAQVGHTKLLLPLSHALPRYQRKYPLYGTNLARIAKDILAKYTDLAMVDIGANVGDTVAIVRSEALFPILCIEGDPGFFALLQQNVARLGGDVFLEQALLGETTGVVKGRVVADSGTACVSRDVAMNETVPLRSLTDVIADWPRFLASKLIKCDTDGLDCSILRGALSTLAKAKPILFFEYDPELAARCGDGGISFFESLLSIGYRRAVLFENTGEYFLTADLANRPLIEDVHHHYSGRGGLRYLDVCAFHSEDDDICDRIRRSEMAVTARARGMAAA